MKFLTSLLIAAFLLPMAAPRVCAQSAQEAQDKADKAVAHQALLKHHIGRMAEISGKRRSAAGWTSLSVGTMGLLVFGPLLASCTSEQGGGCGSQTGFITGATLSLGTATAGMLLLALDSPSQRALEQFETIAADESLDEVARADAGEELLWGLSERGRIRRQVGGGILLGLAAISAGGTIAARALDIDTPPGAGITGTLLFGGFGVWMFLGRSDAERRWDIYSADAAAVNAGLEPTTGASLVPDLQPWMLASGGGLNAQWQF